MYTIYCTVDYILTLHYIYYHKYDCGYLERSGVGKLQFG